MRPRAFAGISAARSAGLTLIELMVALVLGLIVIGGVVSVVISNRASYRTNEGLSQVQESARTAFELLARDIRQAGVNGCDNTNRIANVLTMPVAPAAPLWWQTWFGLAGYDGDEADPAVAVGDADEEATRVDGTDSIQLQGIEGSGLAVETHDAASATITINADATNIAVNDILLVCDFNHSAIFQARSYVGATATVGYDAGGSSPGNCSEGLGFPTDCSSTSGNVYTYEPNALIARVSAVDWYIGNNNRAGESGRSLYRRRLVNGTAVAEEIVAGVTNMQIFYRLAEGTEFEDAGELDVADWPNVNAVSIQLTMDSADRNISTDNSVNAGRLQRTFTNVVALRNRVP